MHAATDTSTIIDLVIRSEYKHYRSLGVLLRSLEASIDQGAIDSMWCASVGEVGGGVVLNVGDYKAVSLYHRT